ncbi:MAG: two-component system LytT family response regulator [Crocinitomix sp.]|jgi:two-component system LytT family response regulator
MTTHDAIIVDDERSAREILSGLVLRYCPQLRIVDKCKGLKEAVESIKKHKPALVFLDIEMPNYAGYEIVSFFDEIDFEIIFVTAYDQYAIKAFEVSAVDYLLKPVTIERLKLSVERFAEKQNRTNSHKSYTALKENINSPSLTKIIIPHSGSQKIISISSILAFEAKEAYSTIHLMNGEKYMVSKNLKHFENLLGENDTFFRSHKSWLVNTSRVKTYSKSQLTITLENELICKLSKYKKPNFEDIFKKRSDL